MRHFTRLTAFAAALFLALAAAACSADSPTTSSTVPAGPRFDGGITFGSGNVTGGGNNNTAADSGSTATRSGIGFGSGN